MMKLFMFSVDMIHHNDKLLKCMNRPHISLFHDFLNFCSKGFIGFLDILGEVESMTIIHSSALTY